MLCGGHSIIERSEPHSTTADTQQTRNIEPMLVQCWADVIDPSRRSLKVFSTIHQLLMHDLLHVFLSMYNRKHASRVSRLYCTCCSPKLFLSNSNCTGFLCQGFIILTHVTAINAFLILPVMYDYWELAKILISDGKHE